MIDSLHRFHGHGSLRFVYKNGEVARSRYFVVKTSDNPRREHSRVAVVISKKTLKSAVGRNRVRRRVYEIVRHEMTDFTHAKDIAIIVVSAEVREMEPLELHRSLKELFLKSGLYKNREKSAILSEV
jgi:ribonuclease P protein component